ncbi:MAG TPA: class I SAM-dependent methyltransferase, partial [Blastocatellia bacterium]
SIIYRNTPLYELAMLMLYGRHYPSRYRAIADLIPAGASVVDLCCGPALLFNRYLREKNVRYTGLDINAGFIDRLRRNGGRGEVCDLRKDGPLPRADYVVMQASLYHFLPGALPIVERMLKAATEKVIIAEPVRNLTTSNSPLLAKLGRILTNPGLGEQPDRFTEASLDQLFSVYASQVDKAFLIAGGREKVYVINVMR